MLSIKHQVSLQRAALEGLSQTLRVIDPSSILERGFALVTKQQDGSLVRSVKQVREGDMLHVRVSDGRFGVRARSEDDNMEENEK